MGSAIDYPWEFKHVAANDLVLTGPGVLHAINFNGMTVVGVCTVYDGIDNTGVVIGALTLLTAVHISCQPVPLLYDCKVETGIYLDFTGGLVADFTVIYK